MRTDQYVRGPSRVVEFMPEHHGAEESGVVGAPTRSLATRFLEGGFHRLGHSRRSVFAVIFALTTLAAIAGTAACFAATPDSPSMLKHTAWSVADAAVGDTHVTFHSGLDAILTETTLADGTTTEKIVARKFADCPEDHADACKACEESSHGTIVSAISGVLITVLSVYTSYTRAYTGNTPSDKINGFTTSLFAAFSILLALLSFSRECYENGAAVLGPVPAAVDAQLGQGFYLMCAAFVVNALSAVAHAATPVARALGHPDLAARLTREVAALPVLQPYAAPARKFATPAAVRPAGVAARPVYPAAGHTSAARRPGPAVLATGQPQDGGPEGRGQFRMPSGDETRRGVAAAMAAAALSGMSVAAAPPAALAAYQPDVQWTLSKFLDNVETDAVERVTFDETGRKLLAVDTDGARHQVEVLPAEGPEILKALRKHNVEFMVQQNGGQGQDQGLGAGIANLFLPLAFLGGLFFLNRRNQQGGGMGGGMGGGPMNPMGMLQSQSKIQIDPQTGVTFTDVAGCDASKLELTEVVDFLKFPEKYSKLGAKTPRGVLLEGPPGTGKTLLARACAGEAGVPFISTSGSEFVEMFVGVGASRVRNLFQEAKKNAPCIIFIDEIDAIGRQRSSGGGGFGTNDEREQTLNQILTEMDGFSGNTGVIVIAATNRGDILDNALLRPGRFDRRVPVDLPDKAGRVDILKVHCRDKPLSADVQLDAIASRTIGFSGASLQNLMNEAAIMTARRNKESITFDEIDYAIDRLTVGLEKSTGTTIESRQKLVAYHEAGHAVMASLLPDYDYVAKVTIIPRSNGAGGFTLFTPSEDRMESGLYSLKYLKGQLAVALGGRIAEELAFGREEITTGASNDLQQVRSLARRMVAQWGFSTETLGATAWEAADGGGGGPFGPPPAASADTENRIDEEVSKLVNEAYELCYKTISENMPLMEAVVESLLSQETIDGSEMFDLVAKHSNVEPKAAPAVAPENGPVSDAIMFYSFGPEDPQ